jgi:hypothetical protein
LGKERGKEWGECENLKAERLEVLEMRQIRVGVVCKEILKFMEV